MAQGTQKAALQNGFAPVEGSLFLQVMFGKNPLQNGFDHIQDVATEVSYSGSLVVGRCASTWKGTIVKRNPAST